MASTPQHILQFARQQPSAAAIIKGSASVSYETLAVKLVEVTKTLQELPIRRGMLIGIETPDRFLHLLLILACEIIGATSTSFSQLELNPNNSVLRLCDLVLFESPTNADLEKPTHVITPAWKSNVFSREVQSADLACLDTEPALDQIVRINRTSGSTGRPKIMENSHGIQQLWMEKKISVIRNKSFLPLKFFCLYGPTIRNVHLRIRMALHTGGSVIFTEPSQFFRDGEKFDGIYTYMLLVDLQKLVSSTPPNFRKPTACYLQTGNGLLSPALRAKALETFASEIDYHYNSNETALISVIDENGVGTLVSGAEAVIVDESDRIKPYGDVGLIKVRTDAMVNGYFRDPEMTAAFFVDGWFRISDIGYMPEPGKLVVLGRADNMLNVGGSKLPSHSFEERIRQVEGVSDIALFSIANKNGVGEIAAAVELKPASDRDHITARVQNILPSHLGPVHIVFTGSLPRTESGKIKRRDVEARLRATVGHATVRQT